MEPLRFELRLERRIMGFLRHAFVIPFLALATAALIHCLMTEAAPARDRPFLAGLAFAFGVATGFAVRSWWATPGRELRLYEDRLETGSETSPRVLPWSELASLQTFRAEDEPLAIVLRGSGDRLVLRRHDWPLATLHAEIVSRATDTVVARLEARLAAGEAVSFDEPRLWAIGSFVVGLLALPLALHSFHLGEPIELLSRVGRIGHRRFVLLADGIAWSRREVHAALDWSSLTYVAVQRGGVVIELGGRTLFVSLLAVNVDFLEPLLSRRLRDAGRS